MQKQDPFENNSINQAPTYPEEFQGELSILPCVAELYKDPYFDVIVNPYIYHTTQCTHLQDIFPEIRGDGPMVYPDHPRLFNTTGPILREEILHDLRIPTVPYPVKHRDIKEAMPSSPRMKEVQKVLLDHFYAVIAALVIGNDNLPPDELIDVGSQLYAHLGGVGLQEPTSNTTALLNPDYWRDLRVGLGQDLVYRAEKSATNHPPINQPYSNKSFPLHMLLQFSGINSFDGSPNSETMMGDLLHSDIQSARNWLNTRGRNPRSVEVRSTIGEMLSYLSSPSRRMELEDIGLSSYMHSNLDPLFPTKPFNFDYRSVPRDPKCDELHTLVAEVLMLTDLNSRIYVPENLEGLKFQRVSNAVENEASAIESAVIEISSQLLGEYEQILREYLEKQFKINPTFSDFLTWLEELDIDSSFINSLRNPQQDESPDHGDLAGYIIRTIKGTLLEQQIVNKSADARMINAYDRCTLASICNLFGVDPDLLVDGLRSSPKRAQRSPKAMIIEAHQLGVRLTAGTGLVNRKAIDVISSELSKRILISRPSRLIFDRLIVEHLAKDHPLIARLNDCFKTVTEICREFGDIKLDLQFESEIRQIAHDLHLPMFDQLVRFFDEMDQLRIATCEVYPQSTHPFWMAYFSMSKYSALNNALINIVDNGSAFDTWIQARYFPYFEALGLNTTDTTYQIVPVNHDINSVLNLRAQYIMDSVISSLIRMNVIGPRECQQLVKHPEYDLNESESNAFSKRTLLTLGFGDLLREFSRLTYPLIDVARAHAIANELFALLFCNDPMTRLLYNPSDLNDVIASGIQIPLEVKHKYDGGKITWRAYPLLNWAEGRHIPGSQYEPYFPFIRHYLKILNQFLTQSDIPATMVLNAQQDAGALTMSTAAALVEATAQNSPGELRCESLSKLGIQEHARQLMLRAVLVNGSIEMRKKADAIGIPQTLLGREPNNLPAGSVVLRGFYPEHLVVREITGHRNKALVPNNLILTPGKILTLVGSGGSGKTTQLLALAHACISAQMGLPVSAEKVTMGLPRGVFVSLNDDESNEFGSRFRNLTQRTFSYIDQILELAGSDPERPIILCLDELFRGTDDVNATALIWAVLARLNQISNVHILTATHYMLLKELADNGHIDFLDMKSLDQKTHQIVEHTAGSNFAHVLEVKGYPTEFIIEHSRVSQGINIEEVPELFQLFESTETPRVRDRKRGLGFELGLLTINDHKYELGDALNGLSLTFQPIHTLDYSNYYNLRFVSWFLLDPPPISKRAIRESRSRYLSGEGHPIFYTEPAQLIHIQRSLLEIGPNNSRKQNQEGLAALLDYLLDADSGNKVGIPILKLSQILGPKEREHLEHYHPSCLQEAISIGFTRCFPELLQDLDQRYKYIGVDVFQLIQQSTSGYEFRNQLLMALEQKELSDEISADLLVGDFVLDMLFGIVDEEWIEFRQNTQNKLISYVQSGRVNPKSILLKMTENSIWLHDTRQWINHSGLDFKEAIIGGDEINIQESYFTGQGVTGKYGISSFSLNNLVRNSINAERGVPLVLTGDNNGGKTVTIKMVLFACTVGNAWKRAIGDCQIPELDVIEAVVSIGSTNDESTSMNEARKILEMLQKYIKYIRSGGSPKRALLMFDELGSSISSEEGSALAALLLVILAKEGVFTGTTTHYHQLYSMIERQFPDISLSSYGFIYSNQHKFRAISALKPGTSRGLERAEHFVSSMDLRHRDEIMKIFQSAYQYRASIVSHLGV